MKIPTNKPRQDTPESIRLMAVWALTKWLDNLESRRVGYPPIDRKPIFESAFLPFEDKANG